MHRSRSMGLKPPHGFTLIELLVVISIIALLISILLPALRAARESARRSVCLANARQQLMGIQLYAHDEQGLMPYLYTADPGGPDFDVWKTYLIYTPLFPSPATYWGLGRLYDDGYYQARQVMFCPSMGDPEWQYNTPQNPWPGRVSYNYRAGTLEGLTASEYDLHLDANRNRALIADFWTLDETSYPGHGSLMFSHGDGCNVGFDDGHAAYLRTGGPLITGATPALIVQAWVEVFDRMEP